jgi:ubiquinone/menaquinone biosynthesis C-methylase UbiE
MLTARRSPAGDREEDSAMQTTDTVFSGSIPALYDRHLAPALFEPYAHDLARRAASLAAASVLETACGTGRVTRALAAALAPGVAIIATDLNQPMLDFAAAQPISRPGGRPVSWHQADALALPFDDDSFDAVLCQFGVMFFPDKTAGYREARRVLKPGGRFLFNVWGPIEANEFALVTTEALRTVFPQDPPLFLARTPHGYHDADTLAAQLTAAGFATVAIDTVTLTSELPSARELAVGFCQGTPLRNEIEARDPGGLAAVTDTVAAAIAQRLGSGPIAGTMQAQIITAG